MSEAPAVVIGFSGPDHVDLDDSWRVLSEVIADAQVET